LLGRQVVTTDELAHEKEVGRLDHGRQTRSKPAVAVEETELPECGRLFPLPLLAQNLSDRHPPAIRIFFRRKLQLANDPIANRLGQVVLEFLDHGRIANQNDEIKTSDTNKTIGQLGGGLELPLHMQK